MVLMCFYILSFCIFCPDEKWNIVHENLFCLPILSVWAIDLEWIFISFFRRRWWYWEVSRVCFFKKMCTNVFAAVLWALFCFIFCLSYSWVMKHGDPEVRQMSCLPLSLLPAWTVADGVVGLGAGGDVYHFLMCT